MDSAEPGTLVIGDWITAIYNDLWYPGLVEQVRGHVLTVNFMSKSGKHFYWPNRADRQNVNVADILCKLNVAPYPISSRHYTVPECKQIDDLMM